jgi:integrase
VTTTRLAAASASGPRPRKPGGPFGSSYTRRSPRRSRALLGPREDRDLGARLFRESGADALRTSIAKACKATGVPLFSPHDLRHRRISLLHARGVSWARIGEHVGQRNLAVTANTYTHVLLDEAELDYAALLAR